MKLNLPPPKNSTASEGSVPAGTPASATATATPSSSVLPPLPASFFTPSAAPPPAQIPLHHVPLPTPDFLPLLPHTHEPGTTSPRSFLPARRASSRFFHRLCMVLVFHGHFKESHHASLLSSRQLSGSLISSCVSALTVPLHGQFLVGDQTTGAAHTRDEEEEDEEDVAAGARGTTRDPSVAAAAAAAATTTASTVVSQDTYRESVHRAAAAAELVEEAEAGVAVGTRGRETGTNMGITNDIQEAGATTHST